MHVEVPSVEYEAMRRKEQPETSSAGPQPGQCRPAAVQQRRFEGTGVTCNAHMTPADDRAVLPRWTRPGRS